MMMMIHLIWFLLHLQHMVCIDYEKSSQVQQVYAAPVMNTNSPIMIWEDPMANCLIFITRTNYRWWAKGLYYWTAAYRFLVELKLDSDVRLFSLPPVGVNGSSGNSVLSFVAVRYNEKSMDLINVSLFYNGTIRMDRRLVNETMKSYLIQSMEPGMTWIEVASTLTTATFTKYQEGWVPIQQMSVASLLPSYKAMLFNQVLEDPVTRALYWFGATKSPFSDTTTMTSYLISANGSLLNSTHLKNLQCVAGFPLRTVLLEKSRLLLVCQLSVSLYDLSSGKWIRSTMDLSPLTVLGAAYMETNGDLLLSTNEGILLFNQTLDLVYRLPLSRTVLLHHVRCSRLPGYWVIVLTILTASNIRFFDRMLFDAGPYLFLVRYEEGAFWVVSSTPSVLPTVPSLPSPSASTLSPEWVALICVVCCLFIVALGCVYFRRYRLRRARQDPKTMTPIQSIPRAAHPSYHSIMTSIYHDPLHLSPRSHDDTSFRMMSTQQTLVDRTGNQRELSIPGYLALSNLFNHFRLGKEIYKANQAKLFLAQILDPEIRERARDATEAIVKCYTKPEQEKWFLQEVSLLAYFRNDQHFLQLLAYSHNDMAICTKYYPHGSLSEWIFSTKKENPVVPEYTPSQLHAFAVDIANGLDKMHAAGFVHSDVKPANILIDFHPNPDGGTTHTAVISDLGSTRIIDSQSLRVQHFNVIEKHEATIAYAPPEVVRKFYKEDGKGMDGVSDWSMSIHEAESTDVYGYGMVLYEMLSTNSPYSSLKLGSEKAKAILAGVKPEFKEAALRNIHSNPNLAWLFSIMKDCWQMDPLSRPGMQQILSKLQDV